MKGSPGGILLIGVGVILLNVGYTGNFQKVWAALNDKGGSSTPATPGDTNTGPDGGGDQKATVNPDLPTTGQQSSNDGSLSNITCTSRGTTTYFPALASGKAMCADTSHGVPPDGNGNCKGGYRLISLLHGQIMCVRDQDLTQSIPVGG